MKTREQLREDIASERAPTSREAFARANPFAGRVALPKQGDVVTGLVKLAGQAVPALALQAQPDKPKGANSYPGLKPDGRAGLGRAFDAALDKMAAGLLRTDAVDRSRLGMACSDLLRAQLRAGQHVLLMAQARTIALAIGLPPQHVLPGIGDPSRFKLRGAR